MTAISEKGLAIIRAFEGLRLAAYRCPAGIWTIGYGSTGKHVKPGMTITAEQASALLKSDVARFEMLVDHVAKPFTQNQFDAMVSLAFNIGPSAFSKSTLLRLHCVGDHRGAAAQFARWNKGGGKVLPGLVKRRAAEASLYAGAGS